MSVEVDKESGGIPDALSAVDELFLPYAAKAILVSLSALEQAVSPYPAQPARDRGKSFNTYVRGVGFYPRSAFIAAAQEPGGYRVKRRKKAQIRHTSEQMDKRYVTVVVQTSKGVEGTLKNTASYSGWVIGSKDAGTIPHQMAYHTETGWPNKDDTLEATIPFINEQCEKAIDAMLQNIAGKK